MKTIFKILIPIFFICSFSLKLQAQPGEENLKEKIKGAYDVFNSYKYDKLNDFIDENFIEHSPDPGQKQGLAGLKEEFGNIHKGFSDYKFIIDDIIINSTGDKASVLFTFTGTNNGEMMGMKPTNKSVNVQGIDYLYFKNGKCTEHWGYMDMNKMMEQMGMMPPPSDNKN